MKKSNAPVQFRAPISPLGYGIEETAQILGVSRQAVLKFCAQGLLDKVKFEGTRYRVTERSLHRFLTEAQRGSK